MNFGNFRGAAKRIEDIDLPRIGHQIGVGEDEIHAVLDVESAGSGFDTQGRPKMLFEPHVFYRNLSGGKRTQAVAEGLAYAAWKPGAYPKDSYPRIKKAMLIDETAALKAASWGLGQVLGENYRMCGYQSPQAMVLDFMADEDKHLEAMVKFIKAAGIDDDLRRHDWAGFAKRYNGAQYAKHNYHGRLAAAYAKWKRIKDTPFDPRTQAPPVTQASIRASAQEESEAHVAKQATKQAAKPAAIVLGTGGAAAVATAASGRGVATIVLVLVAAVIVAGVVFALRKFKIEDETSI